MSTSLEEVKNADGKLFKAHETQGLTPPSPTHPTTPCSP